MPVWLIPIGKFLGVRFLHFAIYAFIGLFIWGIYKNFTKDTTSNKTSVQIKEVKTYNACTDSLKKKSFLGLSLWPPRIGYSAEK